MPNRILRDWTDSLRFDGLSAEAERLFSRLIMKADDYGRFHAEARLLRAGCFPLNDNLRANDLDRWLDELSTRQLILRYEAEGRKFLAIVNFRQRLKNSRWKFPAPPGKPENFLPVTADFPEVPGSSRKFPAEAEAEADVETKGGGGEGATAPKPPPPGVHDQAEDAHIPTKAEVIAFGGPAGIPPDYCERFHDRTSENRMWLNGFKQLKDWRKTLTRFWAGDRATWRPTAPPAEGKPRSLVYQGDSEI